MRLGDGEFGGKYGFGCGGIMERVFGRCWVGYCFDCGDIRDEDLVVAGWA